MAGPSWRLNPAGFYLKGNVGFVEEGDPVTEADMEKIHPRRLGFLGDFAL